ncbi:MAG TPA: D-2-hydroxyacid dehydrogenase [Candidatus Saccharimonadales bacterium]|nr:D-2-hydroxyacid dehydrogenase [Candidatus Saccharimonadales bacterium]
MSKDTVLILADPAEPQLALLKTELSGCRMVIGNTLEALEHAAPEASVLFNWSGSLSLFRQVFGISSRLRWVHSRSVGLERTLFPELSESAVVLTNGSGVFSASLGEFVAGAILFFAKDFRRMIRNQRAGVWEAFDVLPVAGRTVGIVGYGDIGRAIAARVQPLGMKVLAVRRHAGAAGAADPLVDEVYAPEHRIEMISRSDYVVVAAPLTRETRGMVGAPEFLAMKATAVVINVGRGPVIDEQALIGALSASRVRGAALDVFDQEPLPAGHPFYSLENVLLSPHCADHTADWLDNAMKFFIEQYARFEKGDPLLNAVDKKLGY